MRGRKTSEEKKELLKSIIYLNPETPIPEAAKQAGLPQRTAYDIANDVMNEDGFAEYRKAKKIELIKKSLDIAASYSDHLANPDVIAKASARDSAIVTGTMIDKAQLLAGEPTQITESHKSIQELQKDTEKLLCELKQITG